MRMGPQRGAAHLGGLLAAPPESDTEALLRRAQGWQRAALPSAVCSSHDYLHVDPRKIRVTAMRCLISLFAVPRDARNDRGASCYSVDARGVVGRGGIWLYDFVHSYKASLKSASNLKG